MTFDNFDKLQQELIAEVTKMRDTKGKEYANDTNDRLANFKRVGVEFGVSPEIVCGIFMSKHWDSICNFVKLGCEHQTSEPIRGRVVDLITYATLLQGLFEERGKVEVGLDVLASMYNAGNTGLVYSVDEKGTKEYEGF